MISQMLMLVFGKRGNKAKLIRWSDQQIQILRKM